MKQKIKSEKLSGESGFHQYYENLYGERWDSLKSSLFEETDSREFKISPDTESYFLDSASIRAAVSLPLKNAENILDLCAAPGGKTLILASAMNENARLLSNERSPERKMRLQKVCDTCLPENIRQRVQVINKDGAKLCLSKDNEEFFDAILLDAPCSSERHVLLDKKYLDEWSPSRIKTLSMAQWALLSSAWRMLNPNGYLLYSTCALAKSENDEIISKLLKKFDDAEICEPEIASDVSSFTNPLLPEYEKTEFGAHVLPDKAGGAGPLFFCLLKKTIK